VLRSKSPEMVIQEIYAHLLVYHAIRALINAAASRESLTRTASSFIATLRVVRRQVTDQPHFPPERLAEALGETTAEMLRRLNKRRLRVNPRVISARCPSGLSNAPTTGVLLVLKPILATPSSSPGLAHRTSQAPGRRCRRACTLTKWYWF